MTKITSDRKFHEIRKATVADTILEEIIHLTGEGKD